MEAYAVVNVALLAILAVGTIVGLAKGLIRQVIELAGIIGSFFVAVLFAGWLAAVFQKHLSLPYSPSLVIAFLVIFIVGMIAFHFLAISLQKLIHMTFLGWVDRLCGAMLGLIIGMIISSLLVSAVLELPVSKDVRRAVERSSVSMFVRPVAPWLFDVVFSHGRHGIDYESIFKHGGPI
jgi:membrane protein required for colicin V production